eukprot:Lithocolla_globosa_v1_NODE_2539_length_1960_cov_5.822572.p1 type:complete len:272 gc:universal NODE_2539_length_1960_cov_5.822572:351-1166(+)
MDFPVCGVTFLRYLLSQLQDQFGRELDTMTTHEICARYIKPQTRTRTWTELVRTTHPEFVAVAKTFVSHAWDNVFVGLLDNAGQNVGPFWLDVLVLNQNNLVMHRPESGFMEEFDRLVANIGHTVVVLAPWQKPVALGRCWVLWELYNSIISKAQVDLLLPVAEIDTFTKALIENCGLVIRNYSDIDLQKAESYVSSDKDMIFKYVAKVEGFAKINKFVLDKLRQWLLSCGESIFQQLSKTESNYSKILNQLGLLHKALGNMDQAEPYLIF